MSCVFRATATVKTFTAAGTSTAPTLDSLCWLLKYFLATAHSKPFYCCCCWFCFNPTFSYMAYIGSLSMVQKTAASSHPQLFLKPVPDFMRQKYEDLEFPRSICRTLSRGSVCYPEKAVRDLTHRRHSQNPGLLNVSASVVTSTSTNGILYNLTFSVPSILILVKVDIF